MKIKTGIGYDIHRLIEGRKLFLGGIEISHNKGLDGHSDADVVLHAVCDALLGALGKGDIGEHFPNTDGQYKDVASIKLLEQVSVFVQQEGFVISNIDVVIQAQEPNLKVYKPRMRMQIAGILGIEESEVNIKATTMEEIGALGQAQGIAAFASVLITKL